jgi:hypothetical protein
MLPVSYDRRKFVLTHSQWAERREQGGVLTERLDLRPEEAGTRLNHRRSLAIVYSGALLAKLDQNRTFEAPLPQ